MRDRESIQKLVRKAQAGDGDAFSLLQSLHDWRLTALLRLRVGRKLARRVPLEDIAQDVWTRAWSCLERFDWQGNGSFFRWLGGIARHVIQDHARRQFETPRGKERSLDHLRSGKGAGSIVEDRRLRRKGTSPGRKLEREERLERLAAAIEKLLPDHREVILLARVEGLKISEVAQRMDRSPEAVRSLLLRANRELRREFGNTDSLRLPDRSLEIPPAGAGQGEDPEGDGEPGQSAGDPRPRDA